MITQTYLKKKVEFYEEMSKTYEGSLKAYFSGKIDSLKEVMKDNEHVGSKYISDEDIVKMADTACPNGGKQKAGWVEGFKEALRLMTEDE